MARRYKIGLIRGDGVGPEITSVAIDILSQLLSSIEIVELNAGYEYYKRTGKPYEEDLFDKILELDAILKGPLTTPPGPGTFRSINVLLRQKLGLYANIRPFTSFRGVSRASFNFVIIRENTEGLYAGLEGRFKDTAFTVRVVSEEGSRRICEYAFNYALEEGFKRVTLVHKANILKETDGLFREVFYKIAKKYSRITADEILVDTAAYRLVREPWVFQVLVTPNLYGDILSDEAAGLVGSLGLCGSAQIGENIGVFEPVHGSAPDIAGKGLANPIGQVMASAYMLKYLGRKYSDVSLIKASQSLIRAAKIVIEEYRVLTQELGGDAGTRDVGEAIMKALGLKA